MARLCSLFSGSSGNCTYIGCSGRGILIDAGKNCRTIISSLKEIDVDISQIDAIFITHEHTDHISALKQLTKRYRIPVFASEGTYNEIVSRDLVSENAILNIFDKKTIEISDMQITRFSTSHDSSESLGFTVTTADNRKLGYSTDLGIVTEEVMENIIDCDLVMIESNHDIQMLKQSGYPFFLKQRILGEKGHLSNTSCARTVSKLVESKVTRIVLAHLSHENNTPEKARLSTLRELESHNMKQNVDFELEIAPRSEPCRLIIF